MNARISRHFCYRYALKCFSYHFTYGVNEKWLKTGKGVMFEKGRDFKLEEVISNFKKLDELLQDYVLKQIRLTLEYQEKANSEK